jgi:hypothetical protein
MCADEAADQAVPVPDPATNDTPPEPGGNAPALTLDEQLEASLEELEQQVDSTRHFLERWPPPSP